MMPKMLKEIKEAYADAMGKVPKAWATPGYPRVGLKQASEIDEES